MDATQDPIKHVVVLMLENRSFDHMLGCIPGVDGVDPRKLQSNFERPGSTRAFAQHPRPDDELRHDPAHEHDEVVRQIDGGGLGPMGGFVYDYALAHPKRPGAWNQAMAYFELDALPVLHRLAQRFAVCDEWFSSVPGPTWTNRFFALSGTSAGWVSMPRIPVLQDFNKYDQTTIFDRLLEKGIDWRVYFGDIPQSWVLKNQRQFEHLKRYSYLRSFAADVAAATSDDFPPYVFIEPHYFWPGKSDQHPPHSVQVGDELIGRVYSAIRSNESLWEDTLLVVTYDEHGGLYDHVTPPAATPPDMYDHEDFAFDRAGVRVPTVLVSKWIKPGVFRPPAGALMDHTSILRYLSDKFSLGPLGARTKAAYSIADALASQPVLDAPDPFEEAALDSMSLEPFTPEDPEVELSEHQRALLDLTEVLEVEMGASPEEVGERALRARESPQEQVEVAKERVRAFLEQVQVIAGMGGK
jgi:phospholipase C